MSMKSISAVMSASALALILTGPVHAQGATDPSAPPPMSQQQSGMETPDYQNSYKASNVMNLDIQDQQGQSLGTISELILDKDGKVSHVVLNEGGVLGVGGQQFVVPWDRLQIQDDQNIASLDVQQDQLSTEFSAFEESTPTLLDQDQQQQQQQQQQDPMSSPDAGGSIQ